MSENTDRSAQIAAARAADEKIADAYDLYWDARAKVAPLTRNLNAKNARLIALVRAGGGESALAVSLRESIETLEARLADLEALAQERRRAADDLNAELYGEWSRFFLVKHIHNTQRCSSFRPTTRVSWLPKVSGLTATEAVAEYGATLCTICFPDAPTELTQTAQADDGVCPGSGKPVDVDRPTGRENAYVSPTGTCSYCGQVVGLSSRGSSKARKHRADQG